MGNKLIRPPYFDKVEHVYCFQCGERFFPNKSQNFGFSDNFVTL
jgi:hypothetical protein